jgi:hypothetical protein
MKFKSGDLIPLTNIFLIILAALVIAKMLDTLLIAGMLVLFLAVAIPLVVFFNPLTWIGMFLIWFNRNLWK